MKPTLVVLAAGIGSRYGGLKQIDPVGPSGEIIIDYSIYDAIKAGFGKVVFVIRKDIEKDFRECISEKYKGHIKVEYAYQHLDNIPPGFNLPPDRKKPWGTAHAVMTAESLVNEPFVAINADDYYGRAAYRLLFDRLSSVRDAKFAEYCMVGFMIRNTLSEHGTVSRGICESTKDGYLSDVVERTKVEKCGAGAKFYDESGTACSLSGDEIASLNIWGFTPSIFPSLKEGFKDFLKKNIASPKAEYFLPSAVNDLVKEGKARVRIMESPDPWFGITYREDKPFVVESIRKLVREGIYPEQLF